MTKHPSWLRLFFAIEPDDATKIIIHDYQQRLTMPHVQWLKKENLHVTLHFLKMVNVADLPRLISNSKKIIDDLVQFKITLDRCEPFPTIHHPKFITLHIAPEEKLIELAQSITTAVTATGIAADRRPYRGHLTLGKIKQTRELQSEPLPKPLVIQVSKITLFESRPSQSGSQYIPLAHFQIKSN